MATESDILASTYMDKARVVRRVAVLEGAFDDFKDETVHENLTCAISFSSGSVTGATDTVQAIEYVATLFARPEVDVRAGDRVIADVCGVIYEFLCGEGVKYPSHWEVPLIRKDRV